MTRRAPSPFDGFRLLGRRDSDLSLSEQVQAKLSGTKGVAFDPLDAATKWQLSNGTTPWTAPADPIGRWDSKYGTTPLLPLQATAGFRPAGYANYIEATGTDDRLTAQNAGLMQNVPFMVACLKFRVLSLATSGAIFSFSAAAASAYRFAMFYATTGRLTINSRRLDADVGDVKNSAISLIAANTDYLATVQLDYAGTGAISLRLAKAPVTSGNFPGTVAGTPGNTENTASQNFDWFEHDSASYANVRVGRAVFYPVAPGAGDIDLFEAWADEGGALV